MRASRFVRSLKYDAVPRTIGPIELFISVIAATFDTTHATESQHANCTERVVIALKGLQSARRRSCRTEPAD